MIVLKFGGSSVRDAAWITRVLDIATARLDEAPLLVSSAMAKTTDRLVELGAAAAAGDGERATTIQTQIADLHWATFETLSAPLSDDRRAVWHTALSELFTELETLVHGVTLIRNVSPRSSDALLAFGERLSTTVIASAAEARGIAVTLLDSRALIRTDDEFTSARPDFVVTTERVTNSVVPTPGTLLVAQGFIGSAADGTTTTLGRGGSDFSATIYGAALRAERVEIWTDVDGIMTADPRLVPAAQTIPEVSYSEAAELAYFGAKVVHPATMIPAVERAIPVLVCNTGNPVGPKTIISAEPTRPGLRALAGRRGVTIITVHSSRMLNAWGFLSRMFRVFETYHVSVDLIATSEVSVSVSVDVPVPPPGLISELEELGRVHIDQDKAVLSLVGERRWRNPALIRDVFDAIATIDAIGVEMISLGSSDTNLSLVVPQSAMHVVITTLHQRFFESAHQDESGARPS